MKRRPNLPLWQFVALIAVTSAIVAMTFGVYKKWWPWLMGKVNAAQYSAASFDEMRIFSVIMENFERVYYPHALRLLAFEKSGVPFDSIDLGELTALPGVTDAFRIDFQRHIAATARGTLNADTLQALFNRPKDPRVKRGGAAQMMRRTAGGLTRFEQHKSGNTRYPMLIRFIGTYYPDRATQAVGVILDKEWFVRQVPALMDSLSRENVAILFMAPQPPDTQWLPVSDPYRAANNNWKQTMGILDGKDTLWWYGDPNVRIHEDPIKPGEDPGYFVRVEPFNLRVLVNIEFPESSKEIIAGRKIVKWLFPAMEATVQAILIILVLTVAVYRLQIKRNRIALAHLAHSVKTPVARLKLITETLSQERAASPEEERGLVAAVGRECGRLERAVQNAALSLERGKREFHLESGDLAAAVREVADAWKPSFDQAGIRLRLDLAAEPFQASFDRDLFPVLLDNLLDNALRHTRLKIKEIPVGHAEVAIALRREKERLNLTVDDMGGGIPKSQQRRIFQRFGRSSRDAATGVSGLGLGLALVKEIAEGHNGKVWVENNDFGGARFMIALTS